MPKAPTLAKSVARLLPAQKFQRPEPKNVSLTAVIDEQTELVGEIEKMFADLTTSLEPFLAPIDLPGTGLLSNIEPVLSPQAQRIADSNECLRNLRSTLSVINARIAVS